MVITKPQAETFLKHVLKDHDIGLVLEGIFGEGQTPDYGSVVAVLRYRQLAFSDDISKANDLAVFLRQIADYLDKE